MLERCLCCGTANDKYQATPPLCPSTRQTFCTRHWHRGVWRKPARRKASVVASCGGAEAWQFLGLKWQWKALFFSVSLNWLPSIRAGGVVASEPCGGSVCTWGDAILPSWLLPSSTLQQWWDCVACVFVLSLCGGKFLLSFPSSPCLYPPCNTFPSLKIFFFSLSRDWCGSGCQNSGTTGKDSCRLVLTAKQFGTHEPAVLKQLLTFWLAVIELSTRKKAIYVHSTGQDLTKFI